MSDQGRYHGAIELNEEALGIRRRLHGPDSPITAASVYNLACLAALTGRRDQALALLSEAIEHGLNRETDLGVEKDSDLKSLYDDPKFKKIVAEAKQRATAIR